MRVNNRFAVVKMWKDLKVAEDENIERIKIAAQQLGIECVVVDEFYRYIDSPLKVATEESFDFVMHLHFCTKKINNLFSFVALWNPIQFYQDWGYRRYTNNLLTHDDFLSCSSGAADDHVRRIIHEDIFHLQPELHLYHSLSTPLLSPTLGKMRLHYCGINWERVGKERGRHAELLEYLDSQNQIDIYGPQTLHGVKVWDGFKCYRGSLPFDGISMVQSINESGIALVLSSDAHIKSELMSNRLFESVAAGAAIICDENPFAKKFFGDSLLYIDKKCDPEEITLQVKNHLRWIASNKDEALQKIYAAQEIFKSNFCLKNSILSIYKEIENRKQKIEDLFSCSDENMLHVCHVLKKYSKESLGRISCNIKQKYKNIKNYIFVDRYEYDRYSENFLEIAQQKSVNIVAVDYFIRDARGRIIEDAMIGDIICKFIDTIPNCDYFSIILPSESVFDTHYAKLMRLMQINNAVGVCSASMLRHTAGDGEFVDVNIDMNVDGEALFPAPGRFVFKKEIFLNTYKQVLPYIKANPLIYFMAKSEILQARTIITHIHSIQDSDQFSYSPTDFNIVDDLFAYKFDRMRFDFSKYIKNESGNQNLNGTLDNISAEQLVKLAVGMFHAIPLPRIIKSPMLYLYRKWLNK